ncbi:Leucine Rich Repeat [Seminavis robusta]|uniref:Leucine Rich Repeat n=1 Tax=Seminavis robusta TaxID=568900 RepID=A0A9N8E8X2_9STRA|nr:Leucine Rich Repeat [Seminavis robusta]|eukprot:Sro676_g185660.1 Leucine Rich Repeat (982) ;mRNA; r:20298-23521
MTNKADTKELMGEEETVVPPLEECGDDEEGFPIEESAASRRSRASTYIPSMSGLLESEEMKGPSVEPNSVVEPRLSHVDLESEMASAPKRSRAGLAGNSAPVRRPQSTSTTTSQLPAGDENSPTGKRQSTTIPATILAAHPSITVHRKGEDPEAQLVVQSRENSIATVVTKNHPSDAKVGSILEPRMSRTGTVGLGIDAILDLTETYHDDSNDGQAMSILRSSSTSVEKVPVRVPTLTRAEKENKKAPPSVSSTAQAEASLRSSATTSQENMSFTRTEKDNRKDPPSSSAAPPTGPLRPPTTRAERENRKAAPLASSATKKTAPTTTSVAARSKSGDPDYEHVHQELSPTDLGMIVATSSFRQSNGSTSETAATAVESQPGAFRHGPGSLNRGSSDTILYSNDGSVLKQPSCKGPELVTAFIVEETELEEDLEAVKASIRKEVQEEMMQDVVEADDIEVQVAQDDFQNAQEGAGKNHRTMLLAGLGVLLLVVIISVAVSVGSRSSDQTGEQEAQKIYINVNVTDAPTLAPSGAPTVYYDLGLIAGLPNFTLASFQDQTSPQSLAYRWVSKDPDLSSYNNSRRLQRFALATLYFATEGEEWNDQNWLHYGTEKNECTWFTMEDDSLYPEFSSEYDLNPCSNDMEYVFLTAWDNGLGGTLPPELSLLTKLQIIDLSTATTAGTIPTELGLLADLRQLWISSMRLTGTVPTELFSLTKLEGLGVGSNHITGWIPTEVALLTNLEFLTLYETEVEGPIPSEIGMLSQLTIAYFDANQLTSTIPTELGLATSLEWFLAYENQLTGPIPSEVGRLPVLDELHFDSNLLTSSLPTELGLVESVGVIEGFDNQLTGPLPSELGQLQRLDRLILYSNQLTSTIPRELQGVPFLSELMLDDNFLEGNVDNMTFASPLLKTFHIQENIMLTGTIPMVLCILEDGLEFDCMPGHLCGCSSCDCDFFNTSTTATWNVTDDDLFNYSATPHQHGM